MERNALSANGILGSRDFVNGLFYKYAADGIWLGGSAYSQTKVGKGNTEGFGGNARVAYAPINADGSLLHIGATYSVDQIDLNANTGFGSPTAGYSTSYSKQGDTFGVFKFAGNGATTSAKVNTLSVETMGIIGPVFLQGEYATAKYKRDGDTNDGQRVDAFSATASWFVTGESRVYKAADGTYGAAKINGVNGAVEVAARYDYIKNKDNDAKVSAVTLGANYYFNPNVRFMVDYSLAKADKSHAGRFQKALDTLGK